MGVELTHDGEDRRATVLKTAEPTGTRTPPWEAMGLRLWQRASPDI